IDRFDVDEPSVTESLCDFLTRSEVGKRTPVANCFRVGRVASIPAKQVDASESAAGSQQFASVPEVSLDVGGVAQTLQVPDHVERSLLEARIGEIAALE